MSEFSTNIERIINSPVNRSKSKHTYSFSKSMRFEEIKSPASKTFVYELPTLKSNRSTTMGYGKKFDFVIKHINKKVPFYEIPSDFNPKKPQTPAFSFGIAREFYDKVYSPSGKILDRNIPGPGNYNHQKPLGSDALKFSLFGRRGGTKIFDKIIDNPGPGEYEQVNIKDSGKYPVSTFRNTTNSIQWANEKEDRFYRKKNNNPGPGHYQPKPLIDGSGVTFVSRFKSSTARSLGGRLRELSNKNQTPGPGSYNSFSEFGIPKSKYDRKESEKEYGSRLTHEKSKRSEYLSNRNSLSNGFLKIKSDKFNRDYENNIEKAINNYQKFLENDDEKLISRKIKFKDDTKRLESSENNLRFDNREPNKKIQHISELDCKQNESESKENSLKTKSQNLSTKPRIEIENSNFDQKDKISTNESKNHYNKIDLNSLKKPLEKKVTQESYLMNKNLKDPSQSNTSNNFEKSLKSELIKNSEKNDEKSKISGTEKNSEIENIDSFQMQSKMNKEEFLRRTETSTISKKINVTNNSNNKMSLNSFSNKMSIKSDAKETDNKSEISNIEKKTQKNIKLIESGNIINKSLRSNDQNASKNNNNLESKDNLIQIENKSIKSNDSKMTNKSNQIMSFNKETTVRVNGKSEESKILNPEE